MNTALLRVGLAVISLAILADAASANTTVFDIRQAQPVDRSHAWLADAEPALAPLSFVRFCMTYPAECRQDGPSAIVALDDELRQELATVNAEVNRRIRPDAAHAGTLDWSLEASIGDCNDYAVQKRHALLRRGWPMSALALTVALLPNGVGHLVLTVRTAEGDLVLDNLRQSFVKAAEAGYRFLRRQSVERPDYWVEIRQPGAELGSAFPPPVAIVGNWRRLTSFEEDGPASPSAE